MAVTYKIFCLCLLLTSGNEISAAKLNVPRVLLPYNVGIPTNYTLEISEGGCYRWRSSRPEVVTVVPIDQFSDQQCSIKAAVSAISPNAVRQSAIIFAEDTETDNLLRCDVIVDSIHAIEISTTTRELFLEDAPEAFEVHAKNDQGDTFSSLHGVPFEWTLVSELDKTSESKEPILRILNFAESSYETPPYIEYWEQQGLRGSIVLVEGVKTGSAKVRVRLRDPVFMDVKSSEVNLVVVANIVLNPAYDVFLLQQSVVHYRVELIKQGRVQEVSMPSDAYFLEVDDSKVVHLDHESSNVTAIDSGHAMIVLKDKSMKGKDMPRQPSAGIHVVTPSYMLFQVSPGENWALQEFTDYEVTVKIYDDYHHRIYLSENLRVQVHFPSKSFQIKYSSLNGTYYIVKTLIPGQCKINAELQGAVKEDGKVHRYDSPVKAFQEVSIYQILQVEPSVILMPWDPVAKPSFTLTLKARGGTGFYHWASSNTSLVKVSYKQELASKTAVLSTTGIGDATIAVTDVHNSVFKTTANISIQPISDLELIPTVVEAEIGGHIIIPLALYGYEDTEKQKKKVFDDCSEIPVSIEIVDKARVVYNEDSKFPPMGRGCRSLQFTCKAPGHSRIYVQYAIGDLQLKTTAVISCHKQLKPVYPSRLLLLPLGSSADIAFEGGPRPWPLFQEGHISRLEVKDESIASTTEIKDPYRYNKDLHVFNILCKDLGEMPLQITVGNDKSATNPNPAVSQATVQLVCGVPDALFLRPVIKGLTGKKLPCPIGEEPVQVPTQNYKDLEIDIWAKDKKGRKFANITSLLIQWDLTDHALAKLESHRDFVVDVNGASGYKKVVRSYQTIHPVGKSGQLKVTAKVAGYRNDVLSKAGVVFGSSRDLDVSKTVVLDLVEDVSVSPTKVTVFNHATNKAVLNVSGGSGHVLVEVSDESKAVVDYQENTHQILVSPVEDGSFLISVHDLCLETNEVATASVQISGVETVHVKMLSKVQLNKSITATVQVLATGMQPISASLFTVMNLHAVPASGIISAKLKATPAYGDTEAVYTLTGLALGHTTVTFKILPQENGSSEISKKLEVASIPLPIQVFSPLKLSPHNITLVVGATFEVLCLGGPQPQVTIDYSVHDQAVSTVTRGGILTAVKLGKTIITAKAIEIDKHSGNRIVHSEDQAHVYVLPLSGVRIRSPLHKLKVGVEMSLFAMGLNEHETPFAFGSTVKHLIFKWSVNNVEVIKLEGVYKELEEESFAVRIITLRPGHASVTLEVRSGGDAQLMLMPIYRDEIQLQVFDDLQLTQPNVVGETIVVTPNTLFQLKSNRDSFAHVIYNTSPMKNQNVAVIERTGVLSSGPQVGETLLSVTAVEDFGIRQSLAVLVKVCHLSYVMVNVKTVIRTKDKPLSVIPIAFTVVFRVSFHNNIGEKFQATNSQINFRPSRFDIVQISEGPENGTLIVRASKSGQTILRVWDKQNPHISDYVNIVVKTLIFPSNVQLTVGDMVCFHSPLISEEGLHGTWLTDSTVLSVDAESGVALAIESGSAIIYYNISSSHRTSTQVTVSPVGMLTVDIAAVHYISNVVGSSVHIPVYLGQEGRIRKGNKIGRNCTGFDRLPLTVSLFVCELEFDKFQLDFSASDVFETESRFDWKLGQYYCHIRPLHKLQAHQISLLVSDILLRVQLLKPHLASPPSEMVKIPFLPAFHIQLEELVLSNIHPVGTIPIIVSTKVADCLVVLPSDNNVLEVLPPESDAKMPSTLLYPVRVRELSSLWQVDTLTSVMHIHVSCSLIHQTADIRVKLKLIGTQDGAVGCPPVGYRPRLWRDFLYVTWANYQSVMTAVLTIIGTVAALYIGCRAVAGPRYYNAQLQQGVFAPKNTPAVYPYTPYRPSTSSENTTDLSRPLWTEDHSFSSSPHRISTPLRPSPPTLQYQQRTSFIS